MENEIINADPEKVWEKMERILQKLKSRRTNGKEE
jgi:ribosome-associated translation inhibitor RaiA